MCVAVKNIITFVFWEICFISFIVFYSSLRDVVWVGMQVKRREVCLPFNSAGPSEIIRSYTLMGIQLLSLSLSISLISLCQSTELFCNNSFCLCSAGDGPHHFVCPRSVLYLCKRIFFYISLSGVESGNSKRQLRLWMCLGNIQCWISFFFCRSRKSIVFINEK
jgi:hypothetical protein